MAAILLSRFVILRHQVKATEPEKLKSRTGASAACSIICQKGEFESLEISNRARRPAEANRSPVPEVIARFETISLADGESLP